MSLFRVSRIAWVAAAACALWAVSSCNSASALSPESEHDEMSMWHEDFQTVVVQRLEQSRLVANRHNRNHREAQQLLPIACIALNEVLPGNLECECSFTIALTFQCSGFERVCLNGVSDGYCSTPTVKGELDLLSLSLNFEFCGFNATDGGDPVPGICITVGGTLVPPGAPPPGIGGSSSKSSNAGTAVSTKKQQQPVRNGKKDKDSNGSDTANTATSTMPSLSSKITSVANTCTASDTAGKRCRNCRICNQGHGYTFDCRNIGRRLIQSMCTPLNVVSNLRLDQNITFLPKLDDPVPVPVAAPTKAPTKRPVTRAPVTKAPATKSPASAWGSLFGTVPLTTTRIRNSNSSP